MLLQCSYPYFFHTTTILDNNKSHLMIINTFVNVFFLIKTYFDKFLILKPAIHNIIGLNKYNTTITAGVNTYFKKGVFFI